MNVNNTVYASFSYLNTSCSPKERFHPFSGDFPFLCGIVLLSACLKRSTICWLVYESRPIRAFHMNRFSVSQCTEASSCSITLTPHYIHRSCTMNRNHDHNLLSIITDYMQYLCFLRGVFFKSWKCFFNLAFAFSYIGKKQDLMLAVARYPLSELFSWNW